MRECYLGEGNWKSEFTYAYSQSACDTECERLGTSFLCSIMQAPPDHLKNPCLNGMDFQGLFRSQVLATR